MKAPNLHVDDVKPFIGAKDFNASRDFYVTLGWRLVYDSEDLRVLELGNYRFYLQRYYNKTWCNNTMLHIAVDDVDAWYKHVEQLFTNGDINNGRLSEEIKDEGYARVFHVWDPSGVLLHFAQLSE